METTNRKRKKRSESTDTDDFAVHSDCFKRPKPKVFKNGWDTRECGESGTHRKRKRRDTSAAETELESVSFTEASESNMDVHVDTAKCKYMAALEDKPGPSNCDHDEDSDVSFCDVLSRDDARILFQLVQDASSALPIRASLLQSVKGLNWSEIANQFPEFYGKPKELEKAFLEYKHLLVEKLPLTTLAEIMSSLLHKASDTELAKISFPKTNFALNGFTKFCNDFRKRLKEEDANYEGNAAESNRLAAQHWHALSKMEKEEWNTDTPFRRQRYREELARRLVKVRTIKGANFLTCKGPPIGREKEESKKKDKLCQVTKDGLHVVIPLSAKEIYIAQTAPELRAKYPDKTEEDVQAKLARKWERLSEEKRAVWERLEQRDGELCEELAKPSSGRQPFPPELKQYKPPRTLFEYYFSLVKDEPRFEGYKWADRLSAIRSEFNAKSADERSALKQEQLKTCSSEILSKKVAEFLDGLSYHETLKQKWANVLLPPNGRKSLRVIGAKTGHSPKIDYEKNQEVCQRSRDDTRAVEKGDSDPSSSAQRNEEATAQIEKPFTAQEIFFAQTFSELRAKYPDKSDVDLNAKLARKWERLTEEKRSHWENLAIRDRELCGELEAAARKKQVPVPLELRKYEPPKTLNGYYFSLVKDKPQYQRYPSKNLVRFTTVVRDFNAKSPYEREVVMKNYHQACGTYQDKINEFLEGLKYHETLRKKWETALLSKRQKLVKNNAKNNERAMMENVAVTEAHKVLHEYFNEEEEC